MKYRALADTGVFVSELCLGAMTGPNDVRLSRLHITEAVEASWSASSARSPTTLWPVESWRSRSHGCCRGPR